MYGSFNYPHLKIRLETLRGRLEKETQIWKENGHGMFYHQTPRQQSKVYFYASSYKIGIWLEVFQNVGGIGKIEKDCCGIFSSSIFQR